MKYLIFKVGSQRYALNTQTDFKIEPTPINKVSDNFIIYKGIKTKVIDLLREYKNQDLKKFDGLIFCTKDKSAIAFKFEGLYEFKNNSENCEIIDEDFLNSAIEN